MVDDPLSPGGKRPASKAQAAARKAQIALWEELFREWSRLNPQEVELTPELHQAAIAAIGPEPEPRQLGDQIEDRFVTGGMAIFWSGGVEPAGEKVLKEVSAETGDAKRKDTQIVRQQYGCALRGKGWFRVDFLIYDLMGLDMTKMSNAAVETLRLPTRVVLPFVVMIGLSLITPRVRKEELDRFYVKMKTPVDPNPEMDHRQLEKSYQDPARFDDKRLIRGLDLEIQRPKLGDVAGFVACFAICFLLIWLTVWLAKFQG
jgi:SSS family solute:Na+ symporter